MNSSSSPIRGKKGQPLGSGCSGWSFSILEREGPPSLWIFDRSDRRFSTEQEGKLFYATKATRGHRFGGVPTTPRGRNIFLLALIFV